jgi:predicted AAA+ superfamily ATPase
MYRSALEDLNAWELIPNLKSLLIRGGRQVGKTYLVRMFAKKSFEHLLEINLD